MKIVILNGSPRKGNTTTAIDAFVKGASEKHEIDIIDTDKVNVSPCKGCNACECYKGCVAKDDSNAVVDRIVAADLIVFATPVYWWGMTAQLKIVLDKMYCRGAQLKGKNIGLIIPGGSPVDHPQYSIIKSQFECTEELLDWKIKFFRPYYASASGDLAKDAAAIAELTELGKSL